VDEDDVLGLKKRRRIYELVRREPGLHLRELDRRLDISLSTLRHHLRYLKDHGVVTVERDDRYKRYFPSEDLSSWDKDVFSILRREKPRRILLELLRHGGESGYAELRDALEYPSSTLGLYLKDLVEAGLVEREPEGRSSRYLVRDRDRVERLLVKYEESFFDRWVDRVLEIVEESPVETTRGTRTPGWRTLDRRTPPRFGESCHGHPILARSWSRCPVDVGFVSFAAESRRDLAPEGFVQASCQNNLDRARWQRVRCARTVPGLREPGLQVADCSVSRPRRSCWPGPPFSQRTACTSIARSCTC
jgi:DNA-binding transcriptional ArsR family regulator